MCCNPCLQVSRPWPSSARYQDLKLSPNGDWKIQRPFRDLAFSRGCLGPIESVFLLLRATNGGQRYSWKVITFKDNERWPDQTFGWHKVFLFGPHGWVSKVYRISYLLKTTVHRGRVHASHPAAPGSILGVHEDFLLSEIYSLIAAEIYRQHCTA